MVEKELSQTDSDDKSFNLILRSFLRYWYLFLLGFIICFSGAFLYLSYSSSVYHISSMIQLKSIEKESSLSVNYENNDSGTFNSLIIDDEVDILQSKVLMQRVLKNLNLGIGYYSDNGINRKEIYGKDLPLRIIFSANESLILEDIKTIKLRVKDEKIFELEEKDGSRSIHYFDEEIKRPYATFNVVANSKISNFVNRDILIVFFDFPWLANKYSRALTVDIKNKQNKEAKIINISLAESVPEKGKDIINKLIELYNQDALDNRNLLATNTIQFIDERLRLLTTELSEVEKGVEIYKQENEVTNISSQASLYLENSSDYRKQLSQLEIEMEVLASIESLLKESTNFEVVPSSLSIQDPILLSLITKYNELQLEREDLFRTVQPDNPLIQNITSQLVSLKKNILESISNTKNQLTITQKNLQESSGRYASQIQKVPKIERELLEVMRQQGIKQELYIYLLQKREESALSLAEANVLRARVIDPAMADPIPISPKRRSVFLLAFLLSMGLPAALIYMKDRNNDQVKQKNDVIKVTNTPVLGEISHREIDQVLVISEGSKTPIAELFRLIRTNLQFEFKTKENKVILISSSMSGEGKTFFTINLGASFAITGKKVLVMDFDFRMPSLLTDLGMEADFGITDYLSSKDVFLENIIKPSPSISNLFVISSGHIPKSPSEIMMSSKIEDMLSNLKKQFDFILIDTAPIGQVADAFSLNRYTDMMIYLIRYNFTNKYQLNIINDIFANKKFKNPMIVLNDADKSNSYKYGYGYPVKKYLDK